MTSEVPEKRTYSGVEGLSMSIPAQMILIAEIPTMHPPVRLPVHCDYDSAMVGAWRLDLAGIAELQIALDRAVEGIRAYQDRQAAGDA